jgi:pimeloyl-ACP methyl ester carboxylesterase
MATDAWTRWTRWRQTSRKEGLAAEQALLSFSGVQHTVQDSPVDGSAVDFVHSIRCGNGGEPHLVLLHGFGAGSSFWFRTLAPLVSEGYTVHALDWRGCGLSGRPAFIAKTHDQAIAFFMDGLEAWRKAEGVERFVLCGHSMGGQIAARYALAHPERVDKLVMVSPAGMAARPDNAPSINSSYTYRFIAWAWERGATPHGLMRTLGPFASSWSATYAQRRFATAEAPGTSGLSEPEKMALGAYIHHTLAGKGCGEFALPLLLAPGAHAREPLVPDLAQLKMPLAFIYGEKDWMDYRHGVAACRALPAGRTSLARVENAGHNPMLENSPRFVELLLAALHGSGQAGESA